MRRKFGSSGVAVVLALLGFAVAGAVAHGTPSDRSDATTATEPTSISTTTTVTSTTTTSPTTPGPGLPSIILPNPKITPGRLNPKVRQSTIKKTICVRGWTKRVRPPVSYTNKLKVKQMVQYGETGSPSEYEEDHPHPARAWRGGEEPEEPLARAAQPVEDFGSA
jgi:hypothetical protein